MKSTTDKQLVKDRFESSFDTYNELAHVQRRICSRLMAAIDEFCPGEVNRGLEIGTGTGFLTEKLVGKWPGAKWFLNDLVPAVRGYLEVYSGACDVEYLWGDAEAVAFPGDLDFVASTSTIQWFEDKPAFAAKAAAALNGGGYFAVSLFGPENLREVKACSGEGLSYYTLHELEELFEQAGFKTLASEEYNEILEFDTPREVLQYIKSLGINSVRKTSWGHGKMDGFNEKYYSLFSTPTGKITLTYHPVLLILQKRQ